MSLPPVRIQNNKGERFEIAAEELREIPSWDLSDATIGLRWQVALGHIWHEAFHSRQCATRS